MKKLFISLTFTAPFVTYAATFGTILDNISNILNLLIPFLMVLATVVFIWGLIRFVTAAGSDEAKSEAKNLMIWGIIGLFVIVAMWGLVAIIENTFGITEEKIPFTPGDISF